MHAFARFLGLVRKAASQVRPAQILGPILAADVSDTSPRLDAIV